jgi:large-conductance mechanosensitive channel
MNTKQKNHDNLLKNIPQNKNLSFGQKVILYLRSPTSTLLGTAMALSVGWAFKNLIDTTVLGIVDPLIIYIITIFKLERIPEIKKFVLLQNNTFNLSKFIQSFMSFIIIIVITYFIYKNIYFLA